MERRRAGFAVLALFIALPFIVTARPGDHRSSSATATATATAAEDDIRQAYQALDRVRGDAERLRPRLEPHLELDAADRAVDGARQAVDAARARLRDAERALENFSGSQQAENAVRADRARAQQDLDAARQRANDAISERADVLNDRFADADGKRLSNEEIAKRRKSLEDELEDLERQERELAEKLDEAARPAVPDPEETFPQLQGFRQQLTGAATSATAALTDIARAIELRDCDPERLARARARVRAALAELGRVADAAGFDAAFGDANPVLQSLGQEARASINQIASALKALEAHWARVCGGQRLSCENPDASGAVPGVPAGPPLPAGPPSPPAPSPPPGSPDPPAPDPSGGGTPGPTPSPGGGPPPPAGGTPQQAVGAVPLVQDLAQQFGTAGACAVPAVDQEAWLNAVDDRARARFGDDIHAGAVTLDRNLRVFLVTLQRARLLDLAGQFALWNSLLPGSGDVPDGHLVDAMTSGTLPAFIDQHVNLDAPPGSLYPTGQPDTPEFREARKPLDEALVAQSKDHAAKVEAARAAKDAHRDATAQRMSDFSPERARANVDAEDAAAERHEQANDVLRQSERALQRVPVLLQEIDGRPLHEILADPATTPEAAREAIDRGIAQHLEHIATQFRNVRELGSWRALADNLMHPALAPLQDYAAAVMNAFCVTNVNSQLATLRQNFHLNERQAVLDARGDDLTYLAVTTGIAIVTLVGVIVTPQFAIPVLLAALASADTAVAAVEYADKADRASVAEAEVRALEAQLASGGLVDPGALDAARQKLAAAEFDRTLAGVVAAVNVGGTTAEMFSGVASVARLAAGTDDAAEALRAFDAAEAAYKSRGGALDEAFRAATKAPAPATPRPPGRGWGAGDSTALREAMANAGQADVATGHAGRLTGVQLTFEAGGTTHTIEYVEPIATGGFGSVGRAEVVSPGRVTPGLPPAQAPQLGVDLPAGPALSSHPQVAVKFFDQGEAGIEALEGELRGAQFFEDAGVPYARYIGSGMTPDGTPFVVKELIDLRFAAREVLTIDQQAATVEGFAAVAAKNGVVLDGKRANTYFAQVTDASGQTTTRWGQYEGDFTGSLLDEAADRLAQPLDGLYVLPNDPKYALGGGFRPVDSLNQFAATERMNLIPTPESLAENPVLAGIANIVQMERAGLLDFDLATRTFRSGQVDVNLVRNNPILGPALTEYEAMLKGARGATALDGGSATTSALRGASAAGSNGSVLDDAVGTAARSAGTSAASAARPGTTSLGSSAASEAFATPGLAERLLEIEGLVGRLERVAFRLAPGPDAADMPVAATAPLTFLTTRAPGCWSVVERVVSVPAGAGGGSLISVLTHVPDEFVRALGNDPRVGFAERDKTHRAQVAAPPDDPLYRSRGSWGADYDDQWGLKRIGFGDAEGAPAWDMAGRASRPIIVAVLDSGLDYLHPDLDPVNLWRNPRETANGRDDDGNGYVDDLIGWDFVRQTNNPWDDVGHGTHVAGIIAAATNNSEGIAGINPRVRIMPLKILDAAGRGRGSAMAEAVFYAVRHGAHVINLSLGDRGISQTERLAIGYARSRGVVVVAAAGNDASDAGEFGPGGIPGAIAVAVVGPDDRRPGFSNFGDAVQIAAPGVEILSLRARGTDLNLALGVDGYDRASAIVGERYYRASGTSFAAPFVSGVASLLLARDPTLTVDQIERMLLMSATDVEIPGWDRFTGAGRLDALEAMTADPEQLLQARITSVAAAQVENRTVIQVRGSVVGTSLRSYVVQVGQGESPTDWREIGRVEDRAVEDGVLFDIPASAFTARGQWAIRVVAEDRRALRREARGTLRIE